VISGAWVRIALGGGRDLEFDRRRTLDERYERDDPTTAYRLAIAATQAGVRASPCSTRIGGNAVVRGGLGPTALACFERDVPPRRSAL
jgi:hypothetical protein